MSERLTERQQQVLDTARTTYIKLLLNHTTNARDFGVAQMAFSEALSELKEVFGLITWDAFDLIKGENK